MASGSSMPAGGAGQLSVADQAARDDAHLSYFMRNLGVAVARRRGWPRSKAWFSLGRWGMPINILALIFGGLMILNISLWNDPGLFGDFGGSGRTYWNPIINGLFQINGQKIEGLPNWPLFETLVVLILLIGAIYYAVSVRGTARDAEGVTTEEVIG